MTPELANAALVFLSRAELKGAEAPTLVAVGEALQAIAEGRVKVFPVFAEAVDVADHLE